MKVLIVDDDKSSVNYVKEIAWRLKIENSEATTLEDVMILNSNDYPQNAFPDMAVLDIGMYGSEHTEVAKKVKESQNDALNMFSLYRISELAELLFFGKKSAHLIFRSAWFERYPELPESIIEFFVQKMNDYPEYSEIDKKHNYIDARIDFVEKGDSEEENVELEKRKLYKIIKNFQINSYKSNQNLNFRLIENSEEQQIATYENIRLKDFCAIISESEFFRQCGLNTNGNPKNSLVFALEKGLCLSGTDFEEIAKNSREIKDTCQQLKNDGPNDLGKRINALSNRAIELDAYIRSLSCSIISLRHTSAYHSRVIESSKERKEMWTLLQSKLKDDQLRRIIPPAKGAKGDREKGLIVHGAAIKKAIYDADYGLYKVYFEAPLIYKGNVLEFLRLHPNQNKIFSRTMSNL